MERTDFNFVDIAKETPYRVPEGFYKDFQKNMESRIRKRNREKFRFRLVTISSVAAAFLGVVFMFTLDSHRRAIPAETAECPIVSSAKDKTAESWIKNVSDEDLEMLTSLSENDDFLNN